MNRVEDFNQNHIWQRGHYGPSRVLDLSTGERLTIGVGRHDSFWVFREGDEVAVVSLNANQGWVGMERFNLRTGDYTCEDYDGEAPAMPGECVVYMDRDEDIGNAFPEGLESYTPEQIFTKLMEWWT